MKRRPSKLDAHEVDLVAWLGSEHITLAEAQSRLAARGCTVSSGRLSTWWESRQQEQTRDRLLRSITTGSKLNEELDQVFAKNPAPGMDRIADLLKVLTMQLAVQGHSDPEMLNLVPGLLRPVMEHLKASQKEREIQLDERRVALLERKASQADATEAVLGDSQLTEEERRRRISEIYGRA